MLMETRETQNVYATTMIARNREREREYKQIRYVDEVTQLKSFILKDIKVLTICGMRARKVNQFFQFQFC